MEENGGKWRKWRKRRKTEEDLEKLGEIEGTYMIQTDSIDNMI